MDTALAGLEASAFAVAMRSSLLLYPLANVLHVVGALVFFALVAAMDVRVIRAGATPETRLFLRRLRPLAVVAFLVQVGTGVMLLAPEASHIAMNPVFRAKMVVVLLGLANVVLLEVTLRRSTKAATGLLRLSAGGSIGIWLGTAALGRLIAYF